MPAADRMESFWLLKYLLLHIRAFSQFITIYNIIIDTRSGPHGVVLDRGDAQVPVPAVQVRQCFCRDFFLCAEVPVLLFRCASASVAICFVTVFCMFMFFFCALKYLSCCSGAPVLLS